MNIEAAEAEIARLENITKIQQKQIERLMVVRDAAKADAKRAVSELFDARAVLDEVRPIIKSVLVEREELDESILGRIDEALKP